MAWHAAYSNEVLAAPAPAVMLTALGLFPLVMRTE